MNVTTWLNAKEYAIIVWPTKTMRSATAIQGVRNVEDGIILFCIMIPIKHRRLTGAAIPTKPKGT